jgi:hypothetical protein
MEGNMLTGDVDKDIAELQRLAGYEQRMLKGAKLAKDLTRITSCTRARARYLAQAAALIEERDRLKDLRS